MNVEGWFANPHLETGRIRPGVTKSQDSTFRNHFGPMMCGQKKSAEFQAPPPKLEFASTIPTTVSEMDEVVQEPFESLYQGQSGPEVKRVQTVLKKWNKNLGVSVSGRYDNATRKALTLFKAIYGGEGHGGQIDKTTATHLRKMEDGTFWIDPPPKTPRQQMLYHASRDLGKPYVLGGDGVHSTDCGKLTSEALKHSGVEGVSRLADMQYMSAKKGEHGLGLHKQEPAAGDLVFFRVPTRQSSIAYDGVTHVTMYVGDGLTLAASSAAGKVILQPLSQLEPYVAGFGSLDHDTLAANMERKS